MTAVHQNQDPEVTSLTPSDPDNQNRLEFTETAPEHPFSVAQQVDTQPRPKPEGHEDLNRHGVGAGQLKIGDTIKQADGPTGIVINVTILPQTQMFVLLQQVDGFHGEEQPGCGLNGFLQHSQPLGSRPHYPFEVTQRDYSGVGARGLSPPAHRVGQPVPDVEQCG